ncbi:MAG: UBP-type zinc finger domain-containing protein [Chloroflexota bacterium]
MDAGIVGGVAGCEECLQTGDRWVHLRQCLICGHVGCCDESKNRHATKHYHATQHALIRSFEPDEDWAWCYAHERPFAPRQERQRHKKEASPSQP